MENNTFYISLDVESAARIIRQYIVNGSMTGECIDDYSVRSGEGVCRVLIFEKYYNRVNNRLILTVVIDNVTGRTRVHYVGGGGGEGIFFRFDWGAAGNFARSVYEALSEYIV